jgi:uncharacterized lipoprotein YmbA
MRTSLIIFSLCLLFGCTSQSLQIQHYLLHSPKDAKNIDLRSSIRIELAQLSIPEYLKQRGMPMILQNNQVHISKHHVWAEPFDSSLEKLLQYGFEPDFLLVKSPNQTDIPVSLSIELLDLIPTADGDVIINASYQIENDDRIVFRKRYTHTYPLTENGYSHSVDVKRKAILELIAQIKSELAGTQN